MAVRHRREAEVRRCSRRRREHGFTIVELLIVCLLIGILAALTAPFLIAAKSAGNEASAIGSLRAVNSAQAAYLSTCGRGGYAGAMADLIAGNFLNEDMGFNPRSGFNFAVRAGLGSGPGPADCQSRPTESAYYASAEPLARTTGRRAFATNGGGTIWQDTTGVAPAEPFTASPDVSPIE
jgi:type IV pilus assembly protein PilA